MFPTFFFFDSIGMKTTSMSRTLHEVACILRLLGSLVILNKSTSVLSN